jgi:DnaJ-class molecular chaperone
LLSRRDATNGIVVPLEVPLRGTCHRCGGRGETWTEPCAECCGTGEALLQHALRLSVPAGVSHGARLRFRVNAPHAVPLRVEVRVAIRAA